MHRQVWGSLGADMEKPMIGAGATPELYWCRIIMQLVLSYHLVCAECVNQS